MCSCCAGGETPTQSTPPPPGGRSWKRRLGAVVRCVAPMTALVLVPKCPACLAGYVLVCTGIGLSMPTASALRWVMIAGCVVAGFFPVVAFVLRSGRGRS